MKKKMTTIPFNGTQKQKEELDAVIEELRGEEGALMPIMQRAQDIYGYLPLEVQRYIALGLDIPVSEVYGVATFYSQFLLNPKGEHPVSVCLGTACYVKGSGKLMERLETLLGVKNGEITADCRFSLDATRCIGACGLAPVLTIGEETSTTYLRDEMEQIVQAHAYRLRKVR